MNDPINRIEILGSDYEGTIHKGHLELALDYEAAQKSLYEGNIRDALGTFAEKQFKTFAKLRKGGGSPELLGYLGEVLEGRDVQILDEFKEEWRDGFEENLCAPLKIPYRFIQEETGLGFYEDAIDLFSKASEKVDTMIYSQSLKELIDFNLERHGYDSFFTEGVMGNSLKVDSQNKIRGIEWNVDRPGVKLKDEKLGFLDLVENPEEVCYIDNKMVGLLKELKDRGGMSFIAPSASEKVKEKAEGNDIPPLESWDELEQYLEL